LEFIEHPRGSIVEEFLYYTDAVVIGKQIEIFRYLQQKAIDEESEFIAFYSMLVFLYSCRSSTKEILSSLSPCELEHIKTWCNKYLASLWNLDSRIQDEADYELYVHCAYKAACFLRDTVSYSKAIKPLIIAFRMSKKTWVNSNLLLDTNHNTMYKNLASIINLLFYFADEYEDEKELKQFRIDMADGLLDLVKPLRVKRYNPERIKNYSKNEIDREGFDVRYAEPDPLWRYYYIIAIAELGITSDGKGHTFFTALKTIAQNDPSPIVKRVAISQRDKLQRDWSYGDHKRHLKEALWWIREGHVLSLGLPYDREKAQETRVRETGSNSHYEEKTKDSAKLPDPFPL
jgi:hypothetical protein